MQIQTVVVGHLNTNCYIVTDETANTAVVIDPGAEGKRIAETLRATGAQLQSVYVTHGHFDHVTGINRLLDFYPNAEVYVNEKDLADYTDPPANFKMKRLSEKNQRFYSEGAEMQAGSMQFHVMETPGHSRGSVCLITGDCIFAGDTLFRGSCGRTDFEDGSFEDIMQSLYRLRMLEGDYTVYPGHGPSTTMSFERTYNPFMQKGYNTCF